MKPPYIHILGTGAFGSALGIALSHNGHRCRLWGRNRECIARMQRTRTAVSLPGAPPLPDSLELYTHCPDGLCQGSQGVCIVCVPSWAVESLVKTLPLSKNCTLIITSKGCPPSGVFLHETLRSLAPVCLLSGPSFAGELASSPFTRMVLAGDGSKHLACSLTGSWLCIDSSDDCVGVALSGVFKNVLALGAGMIHGSGCGDNPRANLVSAGVCELAKLCSAMGGKAHTIYGLAGLGDIVLTAMGNQSRNYRFGYCIGQGLSCAQAQETVGQTVEGPASVEGLLALSMRYKVDLPLTSQIKHGMYNKSTPVCARILKVLCGL